MVQNCGMLIELSKTDAFRNWWKDQLESQRKTLNVVLTLVL
jgi:hypothetical protein